MSRNPTLAPEDDDVAAAINYELEQFGYRVFEAPIQTALAKHGCKGRREETERWLAAIVDRIDDAVIATDADNLICYMNLAGEALTGWRKQDALGAPLAAICNLVDEGGRLALEEMADTAACASRLLELPATTRLVARNGKEIPVAGYLSPIHDEGGDFLGMTLTLRHHSAHADMASQPELAPVDVVRPRGARPTILLADGDPTVREFGRSTLENEGCRVLIAEDGVEAIEIFRETMERIDLAIVDLSIPLLSGDAVLERLLEIDPDVNVLFSSEYFAEDRSESGSHLLGVISKPYSRHELVKMVRLALGRRSCRSALGIGSSG